MSCPALSRASIEPPHHGSPGQAGRSMMGKHIAAISEHPREVQIPPMHRYLISRKSSMPYFEPSRPMPDSFMPPNGATSVEMMPVLMPTMPSSSCSADAPDPADVAGVEIGGQAELGVVGQADAVLLGLEAEQRRHRAEGLLPRHLHLRRDVGEDGRLEESAAQGVALAAGHAPWRPWRRRRRCAPPPWRPPSCRSAGPAGSRPSSPSPIFSLPTASASFSAKAS